MGLFKKKEKNSLTCPACNGVKVTVVKGTKAVMEYPGFYSGISNSPDETKVIRYQCKDCKNIFQKDS